MGARRGRVEGMLGVGLGTVRGVAGGGLAVVAIVVMVELVCVCNDMISCWGSSGDCEGMHQVGSQVQQNRWIFCAAG